MERGSSSELIEPKGAGDVEGFHARIRQGALEAVQQINLQFLELLCERAASASPQFPLVSALRERLACLAPDARAQIAASGILLPDLGFSDPNRWRSARLENVASLNEPAPWAPHEQTVPLVHSTLLVAWYLLRAHRAFAGILLAMPAETMPIFRSFGLQDLAHIARHHSDWMHPRWERNPEVWWSLLDHDSSAGYEVSAYATLRSLQLCGGFADSLWTYLST
jgi:hypothetical protein